MKTTIILPIFFTLILLASCKSSTNDDKKTVSPAYKSHSPKNPAAAKDKEHSIPAGAVKGDFDGDGKTEFVWIVPPELSKDQNGENITGECNGQCDCYLKFSNDKMTSIKLHACIGGTPVNEGDLNDDGADEVGILPDWWTSCWRDYEVFTFRNNKWKYVVEPFPTHCNQWADSDAIAKDSSKKGYVVIYYSFHTGEDIVTRSRSVRAIR